MSMGSWRAMSVLLIGLCGCTSDVDVEPGDTDGTPFGSFCRGTSAGMIPPGGPIVGLASLGFTLVHPEEEVAQITLQWTPNGTTWADATFAGEIESLATGAEGTSHEIVWNSFADAGAGLLEDVQLKLGVISACGVWEPVVLEGLVVNNPVEDPTECVVTTGSLLGPQEGDVTVIYSLAHDLDTPSWVQAEWSSDDGASWNALLPDQADCDQDGFNDDNLNDLATSPAGETHCFSWNSDEVVNEDVEVSVRLTCGVGPDAHSEDTLVFLVNNDPVPDPGELVISEIMLKSDHAGGNYLEVVNLASHTLDLQGVAVERWNAGLPTNSPPSSTFDVNVPSGTLPLDPLAAIILAESDDPAENGCLDAGLELAEGFTMNDNSTLGLRSSMGLVASVSFLYEDGWFFQSNEALGLDPTAYFSSTTADRSSWCAQGTAIATCSAVGDPGTTGTPGADNDVCGP
jgi:hypothetical protein